MRKVMMLGVLGMVLVGFVSAGLVGFLSNIVEGSVEVRGPVFYAVSSAGEVGSLVINEFPGGGTTYTISGFDERRFISEEIEEIDFYAPEMKLSVEAKLNAGSVPKLLDLEFGYYTGSVDGTYYDFCKVSVNVTSEELEIYSNICDGVSADNLKGFYYSVKGRSTGDVEIKVRTIDGETKAEVLGVVG